MAERFTHIGQAVRTQRVMLEGPTQASPYWVAFLEGFGIESGAIGKTANEAAKRLKREIPEAEIDWEAVDGASE